MVYYKYIHLLPLTAVKRLRQGVPDLAHRLVSQALKDKQVYDAIKDMEASHNVKFATQLLLTDRDIFRSKFCYVFSLWYINHFYIAWNLQLNCDSMSLIISYIDIMVWGNCGNVSLKINYDFMPRKKRHKITYAFRRKYYTW